MTLCYLVSCRNNNNNIFKVTFETNAQQAYCNVANKGCVNFNDNKLRQSKKL